MTKVHTYTAPSGVKVTSNVPPKDLRWWDNPFLHVFWSYSSWFSMVAKEFGWATPKRLFNKHMTRPK